MSEAEGLDPVKLPSEEKKPKASGPMPVLFRVLMNDERVIEGEEMYNSRSAGVCVPTRFVELKTNVNDSLVIQEMAT